MSAPDPDTFRADLARAGITLPQHDFDAALRLARFLADGAGRVRDYLDRVDRDASG